MTINFKSVLIGVAVMLGIILLINIILTFNFTKELQKKAQETQEKLRPARIELATIKNSKCLDCFDISSTINSIKKSNVNITKERTLEFDSKEGQEILKKYKIEKIPAVVLTGEIDKANVNGLDKKENALLFTKTGAPYTNAASGKIEGRVTLYRLVDSNCAKCSDMASIINQIRVGNVKIAEEKNISIDSNDAQELIKKYKIDFAPTIILSKELEFYDIVRKAWTQVGTKESDGSFVLRAASPPFINLTNGELKGLVGITYLTDKSCTECFDVGIFKKVLENPKGFAIRLDKEERLDINDAKAIELIAKYNITQVPTTILSSEIGIYPSKQSLKQFYSVEKDGLYVFRKVQILGIYKDLVKNQVVKKSTTKPISVTSTASQ